VANSRYTFSGLKFCIIGKIKYDKTGINRYYVNNRWWYSQYDIAATITSLGGWNTGSSYSHPLTKSCNYCIVGDDAPSVSLNKLNTEDFSNVIPISYHDFAVLINKNRPLPKTRMEFDYYLKKLEEDRLIAEKEKERKARAKRIKEFAKRCGIEYNESNPEESIIVSKKMDIFSDALLEPEKEIITHKKHLNIVKGKYPKVSVTLPEID